MVGVVFAVDPGALRDLACRLREVRDALDRLEHLEDSYRVREPLGHDAVIRAFGHLVGDWDDRRGTLSERVDEVAGALDACADAYLATDAEIAKALVEASG